MSDDMWNKYLNMKQRTYSYTSKGQRIWKIKRLSDTKIRQRIWKTWKWTVVYMETFRYRYGNKDGTKKQRRYVDSQTQGWDKDYRRYGNKDGTKTIEDMETRMGQKPKKIWRLPNTRMGQNTKEDMETPRHNDGSKTKEDISLKIRTWNNTMYLEHLSDETEPCSI